MKEDAPTQSPTSPARGSRVAIVIGLVFALAGIAIQAFAIKMAHDIDLTPDERISGRQLADIGIVMVVFIMACGFPFTTIAGIVSLIGTCRRTDLRRAHGGILAAVVVVEILLIATMAISIAGIHDQAGEIDRRPPPSAAGSENAPS